VDSELGRVGKSGEETNRIANMGMSMDMEFENSDPETLSKLYCSELCVVYIRCVVVCLDWTLLGSSQF